MRPAKFSLGTLSATKMLPGGGGPMFGANVTKL